MFCFETGFHSIALGVQELNTWIKLASNSEICQILPLPRAKSHTLGRIVFSSSSDPRTSLVLGVLAHLALL